MWRCFFPRNGAEQNLCFIPLAVRSVVDGVAVAVVNVVLVVVVVITRGVESLDVVVFIIDSVNLPPCCSSVPVHLILINQQRDNATSPIFLSNFLAFRPEIEIFLHSVLPIVTWLLSVSRSGDLSNSLDGQSGAS